MSRRRLIWRRFLVVSALSAVAVTAPLLDLYGRNPEVFVANRAGSAQIVFFGLLVGLTVPVAALVILWIAELIGGRAPDFTFATVLVVMATAVGLAVSRQLVPEHTLGAGGLAVLVGSAVLVLHRAAPSVIRIGAVAVPVVLAMFLATSDTSRLIWQEPAAEATGAGNVGSPAPIALLVLDEFPLSSVMDMDGGINEALFPNFARLAEDGTWYRNAFSNSIATTQSVPAILSGRLGDQGLSPTSVDHPENLFTLLAGTYEMHVIEWVTELCPEEICPDFVGRAPARFGSLLQDMVVVYGHLTLPRSARERLPAIDNSWSGFLGQDEPFAGTRVPIDGLPVPGPEVRSEWIDWLQRIINGIAEDAPPTLHYAHLRSPHVPWQVNPSGTHYQRPEDYTEVEGVEGDGRWTTTGPGPALLGIQRHLYQLGFLDTMLGRLFDRLDEAGIWDETMVVVVSDHGASFEPGEHRRWPFENNRDDLYRVPMLIKYPGQVSGEVVDEPSFGIDIVPTIVDVLEIETDWRFDGISLLEVEGTDRPHQPVFWCCNEEGVSTDISVLFEQVRRNHQWVPDQSSWLGVAAVGRYASLVGESVDTLLVVPSQDLRWSLDDDSALGLDLDSGVVQTLLMGRVELPAGAESNDVLLALNGRVAGVGFVSRDTSGGGTLRGLLAEELVADGRNEVDILVPDGDRWLSGTVDELTLELVSDDGRLLDIGAQGSRRLQVDRVDPTDDGWRVEGWGADVAGNQPPHRFYVFAGDTLVASGPPNRDNRNVVRWFDSDDLLRSGFTFDLDASLVPEDLEQLTVVAEFDDYAVADPAWLTR